MAVGEIRILSESALIRRERGRGVAEILEQHTVVEQQQRIGTDLGERAPVDLGRLTRQALLVQQPSQVGPGGGGAGILVHRVTTRDKGSLWVGTLEAERLRDPVTGRRARC